MKDFYKYIETVKVDTVFTVFTTLFVFGMGVVTNWIVNILKEKNQRKNYRKTINILLYNLSETCKKQYLITSKALESYSVLNNKLIGIELHIYSPLFFLNKMDYSLFIRNYVRGCNKEQRALKAKASVKVFNNIGFTNTLATETANDIKDFFKLIKPHQEIYVKNIIWIEDFGRDLPLKKFVDYDFKIECTKIFENWQKVKVDNNFVHSFTNLISPLLRLFDRFSLEPSASELVRLTNESHRAYSDIAHLDKVILDHFKKFALDNKRIYRELKTILKVFNYKHLNKNKKN